MPLSDITFSIMANILTKPVVWLASKILSPIAPIIRRIRNLITEVRRNREFIAWVSGLFPWLVMVHDLSNPDISFVIRALRSLSGLILDLPDTRIVDVLLEVDRRNLAVNENIEVRREVFRLRATAMGGDPANYPDTWDHLLSGLDNLIQSEIEEVRAAALLEICEDISRLSGKSEVDSLRDRVENLLLNAVNQDAIVPLISWHSVIPGLLLVQSRNDNFERAFDKMIDAVISDAYKLGGVLIRELYSLGSDVIELPPKSLRKLMKSADLFDYHPAEFDRVLGSTVFARDIPQSRNGRVWHRIPVKGLVSCSFYRDGSKPSSCECSVCDISLGGFYAPDCKQDMGAMLALVEMVLTDTSSDDCLDVTAGTCKVVDGRNSNKQGRAIDIRNLSMKENKKLYDFISRTPRS